MNRRGFLGAMLGAVATLDPDRLLWVPGRKVYSIPNPSLDFPLSIDGFEAAYLEPARKVIIDAMERELSLYDGVVWTEDQLKCGLGRKCAPINRLMMSHPLPPLGPGRGLFNPKDPIPPLGSYLKMLEEYRLKYACEVGTGWMDGVFK